MLSKAESYLTASLSDLPALNLGTVVALILIFSPVRGLTPIRAALFETLKVPKPVKATFWPLARDLLIASKTASTASLASFLEQQPLAAASTKSCLVIVLNIF